MPYNNSTVRIAQRDDQARINELYKIAADACYEVIKKGENDLLDNYDQLYRDIAMKVFNKETMLDSAGREARLRQATAAPAMSTASPPPAKAPKWARVAHR